jgi:hypothetical protein
LQFIDETNNKIDACIDQTRPSLVIDIDVLKQAFLDAKKKTVNVKLLHRHLRSRQTIKKTKARILKL